MVLNIENTRQLHYRTLLLVLTSWKFWLGTALLFGLVWLVEAHYGWARIAESWQAIEPRQLGIALSLMLVSYLLRALRFYDFFGSYTK